MPFRWWRHARRDSSCEAMTRLSYVSMDAFSKGDRPFREKVASVDPLFWRHQLPLVKGDPASVFRDPESLVLSESAARKYFGLPMPLEDHKNHRELRDGQRQNSLSGRLVPLKVTGSCGTSLIIPISRRCLHAEHSIADRMSSVSSSCGFSNPSSAMSFWCTGTKPGDHCREDAPVFDRVIPTEPLPIKGSQRYSIHPDPLCRCPLTSGRWRATRASGSRITLYGVGIIGLVILFVACFNFQMNLATAQASLRAREIALRKTLEPPGAADRTISWRSGFDGAAIGWLVALALAEVLQPAFERLLQHPSQCTMTAPGCCYGPHRRHGGLAEWRLSRPGPVGFRPSAIFRTGNSGRTGSGRLQTVLVVLQFAVSIGLVSLSLSCSARSILPAMSIWAFARTICWWLGADCSPLADKKVSSTAAIQSRYFGRRHDRYPPSMAASRWTE